MRDRDDPVPGDGGDQAPGDGGDQAPGARRVATWVALVGMLVVATLAGVAIIGVAGRRAAEVDRQQALDPFYATPYELPPGEPGQLIRAELLDDQPSDGTGWRILYRSELPDGTDVAVSGLMFVPDGEPPAGGRPVVAWAHPAAGMADRCAPSRTEHPEQVMPWLDGMLDRGWVVVGTDYAGLGTGGVLPYLIGESAGRDVLNSVRAASGLTEAGAGTRFATWGHSEGGHAALWAAGLAPSYAPELGLVGAAAAAPAAELEPLIRTQWDTAAGNALGPLVAATWPTYYPELDAEQVATSSGLQAIPGLVTRCEDGLAASGTVRAGLDDQFFAGDPMAVEAWRARAEENTPGPPGVPVLVAQGTADDVVPPETTRLLARRFCQAGVELGVDWMPGVTHAEAGPRAGPAVTEWLAERFAGAPAGSTCDVGPAAGG
ncbi:MAG: alpha/beta hydrolase [Acidimicrobiales bacterium]|nr:alpha/beta hydrolase [Acidimicrobiales bacterium]